VKPTTIRLPEDVLDALDEEAKEHGFHNRTEYLRYLIDNRELVVSIALEQREDQLRSLADQVEELEHRVAELEQDRPARPEALEGIESVEELVLDETASTESTSERETEPPGPADVPEDESEPLELQNPGPEDIEQRVERLEFFSPTQEIRAEREEAVVAVWEELIEEKRLTRDEFGTRVFEDHRATFTTFDGWYNRLLVPALEQLEDVERLDEDTWRYVGS